jgi:hypothetical protein
MESINITCTDTGLSKEAEVLNHSDKYLKVVLVGTMMTIELFRKDLAKPYVGHKAGLEFVYDPQ